MNDVKRRQPRDFGHPARQEKEGPGFRVTDEWLVRHSRPEVESMLQTYLRELERRHHQYLKEFLPVPPEDHYWNFRMESTSDPQQNMMGVRIVYFLDRVQHEDWCHIETACIEPNHCTCNARGYADMVRYRPAPLSLEQLPSW